MHIELISLFLALKLHWLQGSGVIFFVLNVKVRFVERTSDSAFSDSRFAIVWNQWTKLSLRNCFYSLLFVKTSNTNKYYRFLTCPKKRISSLLMSMITNMKG